LALKFPLWKVLHYSSLNFNQNKLCCSYGRKW
jgi:hypothetical protein